MELKDFQVANNMERFYDFCEKRIKGIETGIPLLDKTLLGLRGITCFQGATKTNKSTFVTQIAKHYAMNHGPVIFYDRENGLNRIILRLLCQIGPYAEKQITSNPRKISEVSILNDLHFYVVREMSEDNLKLLFERCLDFHKKPVLLVIDSLQKLSNVKANKERRDSIDKWLWVLDDLKVTYEQDIKIIFTSEVNAIGEAKESSQIGYTAETTLMLKNSLQDPLKVTCNILYDRDGPSGIDMNFRRVLVDPNNPRSFCYRMEEIIDESF